MTKNLIFTLPALLWLFQPAPAQMPTSIPPNSWISGTPMPTPRQGAAIGAIGTKIYVAGGQNNATVLSANEVYDTSTDTWSIRPCLKC